MSEPPKREASDESAALQARLLTLRDQLACAMLSTLSSDGDPEASYAPYALHDGDFMVFVSELATHTANLLHTPRAGLLFIAAEQDAPNPFARQRLSYNCKVQHIERDNARFEPALAALQARHGKTLELLKTLPDFHLFALTPLRGTYVEGFGKAWRLGGEQLAELQHLNATTLNAERDG